ncbi:protein DETOXIFICATION 45, chloroplastic [Aristolochia californica]|uniref:protein DETOXIFICATION 45, chloroplastic n=1 Tax=Aristolochia californica TaxID=171875 RepID=UPI0035D56C53
MKAAQLNGSSVNSTNISGGKPTKKIIKSPSTNVGLLSKTGLSETKIMKHYHLSIDGVKSSFYPRTLYKKNVFPVLACQSGSYCDVGPYSQDERFIPKKANLLSSFKEGICELLGIPHGGACSGSVESDLTILALPAIFGQAIEPLSQLMETAYIGRLGSVDLASAAVSVSIFNIVSKLFNVPLHSVTTSFVAEDIAKVSSVDSVSDEHFDEASGVKKRKQLPSVSTALLLATGIGTIEALALYFGAGVFLKLMGISVASPMYIPAKRFLSLRALGAPAVVLSLAVQGIFRGFKDTKTPLFCVGVGNLSSVILLPILVYSFGLGITGAASATVASQYIMTSLLIWSLNKEAVLLPPRAECLQFGGYLKSGGLLLGRTLSVLITMTLGTSMAARQGPVAMAAHQICLQVWLAVSLLSDALAMSGQALIASSFSHGDFKRVKEITFSVLKMGLFTGVALGILLYASFGSFSQLFTKDMQVLQIVRSGMLFVCASQPINALAFVFDGLHYGVSDFSYAAVAMMVVGAISSAVLLYAPSTFGLPGVWSGLTIFMTLRMAAGFWRLGSKSGPWWFLHQDLQKG